MRAGTHAGLSSRSRAPRRWPPARPGRCCSAGRRAGWPRLQVRARCRSTLRSAVRAAADRFCGRRGTGASACPSRPADEAADSRRGPGSSGGWRRRRQERGDRRNDRDYLPDRRGRPVDELAGARDGIGRWRWGRRRRWRWWSAEAVEVGVEWDRFLGRARRAPARSGQALVSPAGRRRRRHRPACLPRRRLSPQECFRRESFDRCHRSSQAHSDHPRRAAPRRRVHSRRPARRRSLRLVRRRGARSIRRARARATRSRWSPLRPRGRVRRRAARPTLEAGARDRSLQRVGIGSSTPTKTSVRSQRRRQAVRKAGGCGCRRAAVMPPGEGAFLQPKRRSLLPRRPTPDG